MTQRQGEIFEGQPPSFAVPDQRSGRIGVVDVGSNSVRMVVYDGPSRSPQVIFNEKVLCGLGSEISQTGRLAPRGIERALVALTRFSALSPQLRVGAIAGIATAAVRDAEDGPAFVSEVQRRTGIRLRVATGSEEGELAARGVLFGNPSARGLVADLGGASLEFCAVADGTVGTGHTTPLGPLRLGKAGSSAAAQDREIRRHLADLPAGCTAKGETLYLVGGAFRALARAEMSRRSYPLTVLHEYRLSADQAATLGKWAAGQSRDALGALQGVSQNRVGDMPLVARLLTHLVRQTKARWVQISGFGLREGVCLDNLSLALRDEDVLLAGCRDQEARRARAPGFGEELGAWVAGVLEPESAEEDRLIRAACLLCDVNWRTHPDYRANMCWETVTRVSITDLGHEGRVFLGTALVARHKTPRKAMESLPAAALLPEARRQRATQVGLAMRLGSVAAGHATGVLPFADLAREDGRLVLRLRGPARPFLGEEVEKRLANLARSLELDPLIDPD